ncbi:conserved hypothetical protein [Uncinocarpus reesii 1704]|uniref:Uncharacterized protein n=1 Tax=Uncinocarpus reesii (strain UAMH 1704) TaxID=336963 RepID=C4JKR7_UNCRE|nr:uncharacterized protein UREG_00613 [Uncinocarpus reesii 1704]EEP75766.1 conserved hypothetical protein [Uncinocarpus reesii 1704]
MALTFTARKRLVRSLWDFQPATIHRSISTTNFLNSRQTGPASHAHYKADSKWLSTTKDRLGKCMQFGLQPEQVRVAGNILQELARDWRELVAGSEGFLTGEDRLGLFRHNVVWGEMDVMQTLRPNMLDCPVSRTCQQRDHCSTMAPNFAEPSLRRIADLFVALPQPMTYPDRISVYHKLVHGPPSPTSPNPNAYSGLIFDVMILSEEKQRAAARCHEDVVLYDYRVGRKVSELPQFMIDQFRHTWSLQQEAKRANRLKIQDIETRLRALEQASWDREGAVEDMGFAAKV